MSRRSIGAAAGAGPTLIEMMIVVAVIGILAAIAIPSYRNYIVRGQRAAARQGLMEAAQYLERNDTRAGCYDFTTTPACLARSGSATVQPATLTRAPSDGRASYAVTWSLHNSGQAYLLTATPCANSGGACPASAASTFSDPACGALTQTGLRGASGVVATCGQR